MVISFVSTPRVCRHRAEYANVEINSAGAVLTSVVEQSAVSARIHNVCLRTIRDGQGVYFRPMPKVISVSPERGTFSGGNLGGR
jgi:hypothetical protein